jgi:hypothetical protein
MVAMLLGSLAPALAGCGTGDADPAASSRGTPSYCSPTEAGNDEFWDVVHASCAIAQDGDLLQAEALRRELEDSSPEEVAAFYRTFVEVNHALRSSTDVSDDICAAGTGLGDDLSTDYRSWIVAHGQSAYDAVIADPETLRTFPDAPRGCGLGQPFGEAAFSLYLEMTGVGPRKSGLPLLEVPARS